MIDKDWSISFFFSFNLQTLRQLIMCWLSARSIICWFLFISILFCFFAASLKLARKYFLNSEFVLRCTSLIFFFFFHTQLNQEVIHLNLITEIFLFFPHTLFFFAGEGGGGAWKTVNSFFWSRNFFQLESCSFDLLRKILNFEDSISIRYNRDWDL